MEFLNQWFWFVVLLPLAALAGWVIGRRGGERHSDSQVSKLSTTYFRGLNYLLNEQPYKAIELFLHIAELDKDTDTVKKEEPASPTPTENGIGEHKDTVVVKLEKPDEDASDEVR